MLVALLAIPIIVATTYDLDHSLLEKVYEYTDAVSGEVVSCSFGTGLFSASWQEIVSGLAWGLGYFGMPHILIRYFSVKSEKEMGKSRIIGCTWLFLILAATSVVGLVGRKFLGDALASGKDSHTLVFINMVRNVFNWLGGNVGMMGLAVFCAGILLSAILAAAMSTADSQLLASASAFASDLYKPLFRKNASDREMLWAGRIVVVVIAIAAFFIASSPKCAGLMGLVSCAWGAFGAAFGPVILLALFWKRMTYWGALAGIVVGFAVDAVWYAFMGWTLVYEIIPGFIAGLISALVVSLLTAKPGADVIALYEKSRQPQETAADAE
jgi:sodium/proline symporter